MSSEVPRKIQQLEAERKNRLKFRLGHEIGAGAKCLNCAEKCPGLDLHFWRKICKLCKCSKDSHDVLSSNEICDWLQKTLFGEEKMSGLKFSRKDRCQQTILQQIPAHDIDPSLCHELPQDELQMFDEYLKDLKVLGFGQGEVSEVVINGDIEQTEIEQKLSGLELSTITVTKNDLKSAGKIVLKTRHDETCASCCGFFTDNSIVVRIEKSPKLWHPECFKCSTCKQVLADLMYFYAADNIYCGRDYARVKKIPRCLACDELIFSKEFCSAEDNTFHLKHFCCFSCDIPLAGLQYVMDVSQGNQNQPICLECFNLHRAHKCAKCNHLIGPEHKGVTINGNHWHFTDNCFCCSKCQKSVKNLKILTRSNRLFCSKECFL